MSDLEPELPKAFARADAFSLCGQRRTLHGTSVRLLLTIFATLCLAIAPLYPSGGDEHREVETLGLLASLVFLTAFLLELRLLRHHPERDWYDGRAVAESAKTLAWRYAVGGTPYRIAENVDEEFEVDIDSLDTDLASLERAVEGGGAPTEWMLRLRAASLSERRAAYMLHRVRDQEEWYARKATYNLRRARLWTTVLLVSEAGGVTLALLKSLSVVPIDLASLAASVIASGAAWTGLRQHESVGAAYTLASRELAAVSVQLSGIKTEEDWAVAVAGAEEAISREHTMWRASRTVARG